MVPLLTCRPLDADLARCLEALHISCWTHIRVSALTYRRWIVDQMISNTSPPGNKDVKSHRGR